MFQKKVFVAPFFKSWIKLRVMPVARLLDRAMKVRGIFRVGVAWCEIRPASEPLSISFFQIPEVRMHCRNHRVSWVKDERDTGCKKARTSSQRNLRRELLRQVSLHRREIHAGLFEDFSFLEHARPATASTLS